MSAAHDFDDRGTLLIEDRFAIVPEWIIDADISDCAYRLYSVLLRYGQTSGQRMPGRALLAQRLRKTSTDTVDRALKELVRVGAVTVERRRVGKQNLTNRYHVRTTPPGRKSAATPGRRNAATPDRTGAARVAASLRPNPERSTQRNSPSPPPRTAAAGHPAEPHAAGEGAGLDERELMAWGLRIDVAALAQRCIETRRLLGRPVTRWSTNRIRNALQEAITVRGWPAALAEAALIQVATDPNTMSPMRLAEAGPWWDQAETQSNTPTTTELQELAELDRRLDEADGRRVWAQQKARADLQQEGVPITRLAVFRRAAGLLDHAANR